MQVRNLIVTQLIAAILYMFISVVYAESMRVTNIAVDGLQRIPVRVVYKHLPIEVDDFIDQTQLAQSIRKLFATGNFDDVKITYDAGQVLVTIAERPAISEINISGNDSIDTDQLLAGLARSGLEKGRVLQRSSLSLVQLELEREYLGQGRYGASVTIKTVPQPRNRVQLNIEINEGKVAVIEHINIVGNQFFSDQELLDNFRLKKTHFLSVIKKDNSYAREKLFGDLESLRSFYMDKGYINFSIESTQVSISPDHEGVYITINILEGEQYNVGKVEIVGKLPIAETELTQLMLVKRDQTYSLKKVTLTEELFKKRLGNDGFSFAEVKGYTTTKDEKKEVDITFFINPGKRIYVRRILFVGNEKTDERVLRREMRQLEGAWASSEKIERSRARLDRLGFFKSVNVEMVPVPGVDDQVDLRFSVEEQPSGSFNASVGYQAGTGLIFDASVSQKNFFGSGNEVSFGLQRTDIRNRYNFSYWNPYYTIDGVSRGYNMYFTETNYSEDDNLTVYRADAVGGSVNFGYPMNEYERLRFGIGFDNTTIFAGSSAAEEVKDFIDYDDSSSSLTQSKSFSSYITTLSWRRSTLNKGLFPTKGAANRVILETAVPGSDLSYYKVTYAADKYIPLKQLFVIRLRSELGFGDGYGDTENLPFYKHFFAGGIGSVRGYESRSLGPRDTSDTPDPYGGNLLTEGSVEFIFPIPFVKDKRMVRTAFFIDGGNVFNSHGDKNLLTWDELRYSAGFGLSWITAIGPLTFTFARAFNDSVTDEPQFFDFSWGQTF